jgi:hypothetical protein
MQLAESPNGTLTASETWSELWLTYNGQHLNVMNAPTLGSAGQIAVTVKAFGGARTLTDVNLGPRDIEFDVNKLIVNLINVAIQAASNNQAKDIEELLKLALCAQIPVTSNNFLTCQVAAATFANQLELESGLGGIHLSQQSAPIIDVAPQNGIADSLGNATQTGTAKGDLSNGLVSGALGPHPASFWYGIRK